MEKPFIYICSLRRTGSTVLSEALTLLPHSFIFREPRLATGRFAVKPYDVELFHAQGIHLEEFATRWRQLKLPSAVGHFKDELVPKLQSVCTQLGVKEIHNRGWKDYLRHFPSIRVILTGRDPRDIFLSLHDRVHAGTSSWKGEFTPEALAAHLSEEFEYQLAASEYSPFLKVRYEDFCIDATCLDHIKAFVHTSLPSRGAIGAFNASNVNRQAEFTLHGHEVTTKRIDRWKDESDEQLRDAACRVFDAMPGYCKYWGYEYNSRLPSNIHTNVDPDPASPSKPSSLDSL